MPSPRQSIALIAGGAVAAYFVVHHAIVGSAVVCGASMEPTLEAGAICLLNKGALLWRQPHRGDLVAFTLAGERSLNVKRVIGLPGDVIRIGPDGILINNAWLEEPYLRPDTITQRDVLGDRIVVPPGRYFLLGDNREASEDSRTFGCVRQAQLTGYVVPFKGANTPPRLGARAASDGDVACVRLPRHTGPE